jgi:hypothetical protein
MKTFTLSEENFCTLQSKCGFQVIQKGKTPGPVKKVQIKSGTQTSITYTDREINGKMVPKADAHVHVKDVFQDREYPTYEITFEFVNEIDEKTFDAMLMRDFNQCAGS